MEVVNFVDFLPSIVPSPAFLLFFSFILSFSSQSSVPDRLLSAFQYFFRSHQSFRRSPSQRKMSTKASASKPHLFDRLILATKAFLDRNVDERQLRETVHDISEANLPYKIVPLSSLTRKEILKAFNLKVDTRDNELENVMPMPIPKHLGMELERRIRRRGRVKLLMWYSSNTGTEVLDGSSTRCC